MSTARKREGGFVGGFVEGFAKGLGAILEDGVHGVEYSIKSSQGIDMEVEILCGVSIWRSITDAEY